MSPITRRIRLVLPEPDFPRTTIRWPAGSWGSMRKSSASGRGPPKLPPGTYADEIGLGLRWPEGVGQIGQAHACPAAGSGAGS
jgi:hypothetical protein